MLGIEEDGGKMSSIKGSRAVSKGEVIGLSVGQNDDEEDDELDPPDPKSGHASVENPEEGVGEAGFGYEVDCGLNSVGVDDGK